MANILFVILIVLMSTVLTGVFRYYAVKSNLMDIPNARSSHVVPTPRGGGISIVVTFLLGSLPLWQTGLIAAKSFWVVMSCGGLVSFIGLVDDHQHLSAKFRFCVHAGAAAGTFFFLKELPSLPWITCDIYLGWPGYFLAAIALIGLLNLYNFMDGIDGIAAVETISVTGGAALILWLNHGNSGYVYWLVVLASATVGFLFWNWPPAKIFMGDVCSGFLGFVLGVFAIITSEPDIINIWSWLILLGVFFVDATVTLLRRIIRKERFYQAHRSHAYQILSRRFESHRKVSLGVLFVNVFWLIPLAFVSSRHPSYSFLCVLIAFFPLSVLAIKVGAGITND